MQQGSYRRAAKVSYRGVQDICTGAYLLEITSTYLGVYTLHVYMNIVPWPRNITHVDDDADSGIRLS